MRKDTPHLDRAPGSPIRNQGLRYLKKIEPYAGPFLILAVGWVVLAWSWEYGPDPIIDFGRELYVPWRIAAGDVLYRDIVYLNGPLSPYWNALIFRVFGESLQVLLVANAILVALITALLYTLLRRASDRLAATTACLAFVSFIAFTQIGEMGNYNYLTPYSHEITHGLLLSLACLWTFSLHSRYGRKAVLASGFLLGLAFLTKQEVFLATGLAVGSYLVFSLRCKPPDERDTLPWIALFGAALALPTLLAFCLLLWTLPVKVALHALIDPWLSILNPQIISTDFYRWVQGTDELSMNLALIRLWILRYAIFTVPLVVVSLFFVRNPVARWITAAGLFALLLFNLGPGPYIWPLWPDAGLYLSPPHMRIQEWPYAVRPLPVVLPLLGLGAFAALLRHQKEEHDTHEDMLRLILILFALGLLAKIFFFVKLHHYGFVLAMPGTMLLIVALVSWIPRVIDHYGGAGIIFRAASLALMIVATGDMITITKHRYAKHSFQIGNGGDMFRAGPKALYASIALQEIETRVAPNKTLAVIPEGIMLNYLSRRETSTPHTNFMPTEVIIYGEDRILRDFKNSPPDYIAMVHKDTTEHGYPFFGQDYAQNFYAWIQDHYTLVLRIGQPPLQRETDYGIDLLRRRAPNNQSSRTNFPIFE
mgnify:CR=1 FL=1